MIEKQIPNHTALRYTHIPLLFSAGFKERRGGRWQMLPEPFTVVLHQQKVKSVQKLSLTYMELAP